ncbi:MAG: type IV pilus modification protein PilV [Pseudomonadota bacterium]|nr:type IV pilus modification protein PilV [Pseudomonadota bacterium]
MHPMKSQSGLGLIEVLVTIVITTIGLLGLSAMQMQSIRTVSDTGNRTHAIWVANDLINRIRANAVAVDSYVTDGELRCNDPLGAVKMCAAYSTNGAQQAPAADCTNQDLALFDQYEALCGISTLTGENGFSSSASFINTPGLSISDEGNGDYRITLSWNSRTAGKDDQGNEVYRLEQGTLATDQREDYSVVFRP